MNNRGVTESFGEALALLKKTRARLIAEGRDRAEAMLQTGLYPDGITTGDVFGVMEMLESPGINEVKAHWVSAIFRDPRFKRASSELRVGIGHDKLSNLWVLA